MKYRVPIDFVGNIESPGTLAVYGGKLDAWSFEKIDGYEWFSSFRNNVINSMNRNYLPVYRLADGEFRFLLGRKFRYHRPDRVRELFGYIVEKMGLSILLNMQRTSWGEFYKRKDIRTLKQTFWANLSSLLNTGYLAPFINDNANNYFCEYNKPFCKFAKRELPSFSQKNYIPFHFVNHLIVGEGWNEIFYKRRILIVTSFTEEKKNNIEQNILRMGADQVTFRSISATHAMMDKVDTDGLQGTIDLCFVAAGIGALNILCQLESLKTAVIDIGGLMECFNDPRKTSHAIFKLPV